MPSREDIEKLSRELHEDVSSQNDEKLHERIEKLRGKNDEIVAEHDAAIRAPLESQLTVAEEEIERLKKNVDVARKDRDSWLEKYQQKFRDLESRLTAANAKVKKLQKVIEDYIHNDIGRKDTLYNLTQALADTEAVTK